MRASVFRTPDHIGKAGPRSHDFGQKRLEGKYDKREIARRTKIALEILHRKRELYADEAQNKATMSQ